MSTWSKRKSNWADEFTAGAGSMCTLMSAKQRVTQAFDPTAEDTHQKACDNYLRSPGLTIWVWRETLKVEGVANSALQSQ